MSLVAKPAPVLEMAVPTKSATKPAAKQQTIKYVMDCTQAHKDNIMDPAGLEKFFYDHIKVDSKTGNFEKTDKRTGKTDQLVTISLEGSKVFITAVCPLIKKRYIKVSLVIGKMHIQCLYVRSQTQKLYMYCTSFSFFSVPHKEVPGKATDP